MNDYIVYTGNSYPHKNLSRLIDAVLIVKIRLIIVSGRSVFVDRLKREVIDKKAQKYVEIKEFVEDKALNEIYRKSLAFVFPTLEEGFGLPPMEAINAGTIAIVSNIPVLQEVYHGSVYYFDPLDTNSIAATIKDVKNLSTKQRLQKIKDAQNFLKRYSWGKMAEETLKVYEQASK